MQEKEETTRIVQLAKEKTKRLAISEKKYLEKKNVETQRFVGGLLLFFALYFSYLAFHSSTAIRLFVLELQRMFERPWFPAFHNITYYGYIPGMKYIAQLCQIFVHIGIICKWIVHTLLVLCGNIIGLGQMAAAAFVFVHLFMSILFVIKVLEMEKLGYGICSVTFHR